MELLLSATLSVVSTPTILLTLYLLSRYLADGLGRLLPARHQILHLWNRSDLRPRETTSRRFGAPPFKFSCLCFLVAIWKNILSIYKVHIMYILVPTRDRRYDTASTVCLVCTRATMKKGHKEIRTNDDDSACWVCHRRHNWRMSLTDDEPQLDPCLLTNRTT